MIKAVSPVFWDQDAGAVEARPQKIPLTFNSARAAMRGSVGQLSHFFRFVEGQMHRPGRLKNHSL